MPRGRMLNKVISTSEKLSKVSIESALLYTWMIPHLDVGGKIFGNPEQIKGIVVPYRKEFTIKKIEKCLGELSKIDLILIYGDVCKYVLIKGFSEHQTINESKEATSIIPDPTPELLQSDSGVTPGKVKLSKSKVKLSKEKGGDEHFLGIFNVFLPPELQNDWCAFLDYCYERGDIKINRATITEQAKFLREHLKDAKKIMYESIKNNWKGLFELKESKNGIYEKYITENKLRRIAEDIANDPDLKR